MIDLERLLKLPATEQGLRRHAERLQLWRLCSHAACLRARACRDPLRCGKRLADWAAAIKAARLEHAVHNPEMDAFRFDLAERLERLARSEPEASA